MRRMRIALLSATVLFVLSLLPQPVEAEGEGWDISVSGYGGYTLLTSPDIKVTDDIFPTNVSIRDVRFKNSTTFGGKLTAWSLRPFATAGLNFGVELEAMQYFTSIQPQGTGAEGFFGPFAAQGLTVGGAIFSAPVHFRVQIASVNFLWRYAMGVTPDLPNGRWYPYFGIGVGVQRTRVMDPLRQFSFDASPATVTSTDPMFQGIGGFKFFLTRNIGLFGEYKYTHSNQTFDFIASKARLSLDANHFLGGVAVHF